MKERLTLHTLSMDGSAADDETGKQRVMLHDLPRLAAVLRLPVVAFLPPKFWGLS